MIKVPIYTTYTGDRPKYLDMVIKQAVNFNNEVVVVLDEPVPRLEDTYVHLSTNDAWYELHCIKRWALILEEMKIKGHEVAYIMDTDVLVYGDMSKDYQNYKKYDYTVILNHHLGNCYWKIDNLMQFVAYIFSCYDRDGAILSELEEYFHSLQEKRVLGGVNDIKLMELFFRDSEHGEIYNLLKPKNGVVHDHNIRINENGTYEHTGQMKLIRMHDDQPYCLNMKTGLLNLFRCLHFQGMAKFMMKDYVTDPKGVVKY